MKTQNLKDKSNGGYRCNDKEEEQNAETNIGGDAAVKDEEETVKEDLIGNRPDDRE